MAPLSGEPENVRDLRPVQTPPKSSISNKHAAIVAKR